MIVSLGLYIKLISISCKKPSPAQFSQAPSGALKEKDAGVIFGYDIPQLLQVLPSEKNSSSLPIRTFTSPPDCKIASSMSSVTLFLNSLLVVSSVVSLSMTKSMLCFLFSSSSKVSMSSRRYVSLSIITLRKPLDNNFSSKFLKLPLRFFINGETMITLCVEPFILLSTFCVISSIVWESMGILQFGQ